MKRQTNFLNIGVLLLATTLLVPACNRPDDEDKDKKATRIRSVPVEVEKATVQTLRDTIISTSAVDARQSVDLMAEIPGSVVSLNVEQGDTVKAKQTLAKIQRAELALGVESASASVKRFKAEVERLKPLLDKGIISRQIYDEAVFRYEQARGEQKRARSAASDAILRSPFAGVVATRYVSPGQQVAVGTPVLRIVNPADLLVEVNLPEQTLATMKEGQSAFVVSDALGKTHRFQGTIEKISPVVDPRTGTVRVRIDIDDKTVADRPTLRPGMFVTTHIVTNERTNALAIPRRAVNFTEDGPVAFVAEADTARRVKIETGIIDGNVIEVRSGVKPGDAVVVVGQEGLKDGTPIVDESRKKTESPDPS